MSDTTTPLQAGTPLDMIIAEKIMGWTDMHRVEGQYNPAAYGNPPYASEHGTKVPHYSTYADDDCEVLEHVRMNWEGALLDSFVFALSNIWQLRWKNMETRRPNEMFAMWYEPGDYSKAALAAKGEHDG